MDFLTTAAIEFPCDVCGGRSAVTLRQILLSQEQLAHEGCVTPHGEGECPPAVYAPLVEHDALVELQQVWRRLEERARAVGGRLVAGPGEPHAPRSGQVVAPARAATAHGREEPHRDR